MIQDLEIFQSPTHTDSRGEFIRIFDERKKAQSNQNIKQVNISRNPKKHTLRGLHFQVDKETEHKVLYLNTGEIFLVVIDLREKSATHLEKFELLLNCKQNKSIFIPAGCATGWLSMEESTEIVYLMFDRFEDCVYSGIRYNDPVFNISWPAKPLEISEKDMTWDYFKKNK
jgi:dTDP-4-dehydrorhamnose 3,5-epimerase